jgi:2-polyprenyl-3-methyl-5-hydroxy-6-metoxy-1,4-benzoquinol methylase
VPESVVCNLCGSSNSKLLFKLRDHRLQVDDTEWNAVRCRECGLGYLNPRPSLEEIERYYPRAYFDQRNGNLERYSREAAYLSGHPGRLLDIGAASGAFLALMRDRGWDVLGIEPAAAAESPYGVPIIKDAFPGTTSLPAGHFDAITAWAVFEHLHDPAASFRECARLLRPAGKLVIQVPNLRSIQSRWALQEDVPRHLYFFTPSTLRMYGDRTGLQLQRIVHTTNLFGGAGRGVLRLFLVRAMGKSVDDFFEVRRTPRRERFRKWPFLASAWTSVAALERIALTDFLIRAARVSGQIVAEFERMPDAAARAARSTAP